MALVARALAQQTPIVLLDEATSNLDIKHKLDILDIVRRRVKDDGLAVGAIIHDINTAISFCDEIVLVHPRGLLGPGAASELITQENLQNVYGVHPDLLQIEKRPLHVTYRMEACCQR